MKAAKGVNYDEELRCLEDSCYAPDLDFSGLRKQLPFLVDVVKKCPVHKVTSLRTICDAMKKLHPIRRYYQRYTML